MKGRTMNPVIQLKLTTPVFLVALLLVGFAKNAAMGDLPDPLPGRAPNHPVFRVNFDKFAPPPCAGEKVHLRGELHLHFKTENGVATPNSANLKEVTGTGAMSRRTYRANNQAFEQTFEVKKPAAGLGFGEWILKFHVVGKPNPPPQGDPNPGKVFRFTLEYTVIWDSKNGKVRDIAAKPRFLCP
jgi:hypothetical protein